jgi:hypothetical protein
MPAVVLRGAFLLVAFMLCALVLPGGWRVAGVLCAIGATVAPQLVAPWWLLLLLGAGQLWRTPSPLDLGYHALVAGLPLLHGLSGISALLARDARVQMAALSRPIWRYGTIQLVMQPASAAALWGFAGRPGSVAGLSLVSALLLTGIGAALVREWHGSAPSA